MATETMSTDNRVELAMALQDYLAAPGVSKHDLDAIAKCPAYYRDREDGKIQEETAEHLRVGQAAHSLILEATQIHVVRPETYTNEKGETKPWNANSKTCRAWLHEHQSEVVLAPDQDDWLQAAREAVAGDSRCSELLIAGQPEVSMFCRDVGYRMHLKCRPDWADFERGIYVDLKTVADASTAKFRGQIARYRWHVQAAMVRKVATNLGYPFKGYYFIAVEKSDPPRLNVRKLSTPSIDRGAELLSLNMATLIDCQTSGEWPDYSGDGRRIESIEIPSWAMTDNEPLELTIGGNDATL